MVSSCWQPSFLYCLPNNGDFLFTLFLYIYSLEFYHKGEVSLILHLLLMCLLFISILVMFWSTSHALYSIYLFIYSSFLFQLLQQSPAQVQPDITLYHPAPVFWAGISLPSNLELIRIYSVIVTHGQTRRC